MKLRALWTGKGLESVAALISDFDGNLLSFVDFLFKSNFTRTLAKFCFSFRYPTGSNEFECLFESSR